MHTLADAFIKPFGKVTMMGHVLNRFEIFFQSKVREYYCQSETEYEKWIEKLNEATGHTEITNKYEVIEKIGSGKYGVIQKVKNKESGEFFCLKVISKSSASSRDLEDMKMEVEIMKICQHPNLVKLYDIFEAIDYKYIGKINQTNYSLRK